MNKIISTFIANQQVASVCVIDTDGKPYCFSCFYSYDDSESFLIFKSSLDTYHGPLLQESAAVAGTILPSKFNFLAIRGLQFEGTILLETNEATTHAKTLYYKQHPMSIAMKGQIWIIQLEHLKLTDNTKGFGKKFVWQRNSLFVNKDEGLLTKTQAINNQ